MSKIIFLIVVLLLAPLHRGQAQTSYVQDPRTQIVLTRHEAGMSLRHFLKDASKKVPLSCDDNCAELKLHFRLRNRPLAQVMASLAELVPGEWVSTTGKSYRLVMKSSAVKRRGDWWRLFESERNRALEEIKQNWRTNLQKDSKQSPTTIEGSLDPREMTPNDQRDFFFSLASETKDRLANAVDDTGSYYASPGMKLFSSKAFPVILPYRDVPLVAQQILQRTAHSPLATDALIILVNWNSRIIASVIGADGQFAHSQMTLENMDRPARSILVSVDHLRLHEMVSKLPKAYPANWRRLSEDYGSTFWTMKRLPNYRLRDIPLRAAQLEAISHADDFDFISDDYARGHQSLASPMAKGDPAEHLDQFGEMQDSAWKKRGDLYLVRNNKWYRDDRLEVPEEELQQWLKSLPLVLDRKKSPVDEDLSKKLPRAITYWKNLSLWQVANGLLWYTPPTKDENGELVWREVTPSFQHEALFLISNRSLIEYLATLPQEAIKSLCAGTLSVHDIPADFRMGLYTLTPTLLTRPELARERTLLSLGWGGALGQELEIQPVEVTEKEKTIGE